ncbi:transcriptional regulator, MarR family [Elizabethkingia anophelis NUHP1]|nr:transcriptional regulator, MarR family [Elizabethkingia anophelis NUHP1]
MLLQNRGEISIADIAESLGYSHPSVVVIVKKMSEKDYLHIQKDKDDKRKQLVSLSSKATEILPELELIWQSCESAILKLLSDDLSIFSFLDDIDAELKANSFYNRFKQEYQKSINT